MTEVLDCYHGPDARKLWLLSFAEKANDKTRTGWPTRGVLAHRTGRSPSRVSHISDELIAEGILKRDGGGNRSGPARFILLPLADSLKGALWAHPSDEADAEQKGAPTPHSDDPVKGAPRAHPKPEVKGAESPVKGAESALKSADPRPLPAETIPLPLIEPSELQPSSSLAPDGAALTAQTILASFIDWVRSGGGELTRRTTGQLAKQIGDLLDQNVDDRHIRRGLADWYAAGKNPSLLDSFVNDAVNAAARGRAVQNGGRSSAPGPDRARGWIAAGVAHGARSAGQRKEISE